MRKTINEISNERRKKQTQAATTPAATTSATTSPATTTLVTQITPVTPVVAAPVVVLGKNVVDPTVSACTPDAGFETFTPYKNLWVNVTR